MAKVFDNHGVAHVWAQQSQSEGRSNNGNFSFDGSALISYRTMIANIVETPDGSSVALITSETYSVTTTGKHMNPAFSAVRGKYDVFRVPFLLPNRDQAYRYRGNHGYASIEAQHEGNLKHFVAKSVDATQTAMRLNVNWYYAGSDEAERLRIIADSIKQGIREANNYANRFGLDFDCETQMAIADQSAKEASERLTRLLTDPKRIEKARKAREAREKAQAKRDALLALEASERLAKWLSGEYVPVNSLPAHERGYLFAYMRIKGNNVETSRGASVPLADAVKLYLFMAALKQPWQGSIACGHFMLTRIENDVATIGCHRLHMDDMRALYGVYKAMVAA